MPKTFTQQIERIRSRQQRRRIAVATCWAFAALAVVAIAAAAIDRGLGTHELGGRVLTTFVWVMASVWIGRRWLAEVARPAIRPIDVARQVERRRPKLRDTISSALQFSSQSAGELGAGSESLRRAVVLEASREVEDFQWDQLVPRQPLRRALSAIACVFAILMPLIWLQPHAFGIGLARLINPLGTAEWPREHSLEFVDPPMLVAVGDDLRLTLRDRVASLPASVEVHFRFWREGRWVFEAQTLRTAQSPLEIERANLREACEFRATGGDHHNMPWHAVEVAIPPVVTSLQLSVVPPRYTALPKQPLVEPFRVLSGSGLQLTGQTDQAVVAIALHRAGSPPIEAQLDLQGQAFSIAAEAWLVATQADAPEHRDYTLVLTTAAGLQVRCERPIRVEILPDLPPEVRFLSPSTDLSLVANARVELAVESADEIATQQIRLTLKREGELSDEIETVSVFRGPAVLARSPAQGLVAALSGVKQRERVDYAWDLAPLHLQPGSVVEVIARATDYQPAEGIAVRPLRWTIISHEEMLRRIDARENWILSTLQYLRQRQRTLQNQTEGQLHAHSPSKLLEADWAHAELFEQREVFDALAGTTGSVAEVAWELLAELRRNRLERPESSARLQSLQLQMEGLASESLPAAERGLSKLTSAADRLAPDERNTLLSDLLGSQATIVAELDRALADFERYNAQQTLTRELMFMQNDQQQLLDHCREEIAPVWLQNAQAESRTDPQWPHATRRQRDLATRLAEWVQRVEQTGQALQSEEPAVAQRLASTARLAREIAVQSTMRSAAERLTANQLGRALSLQEKSIAQLQALFDQLSDPQTRSAEREIAALRDAQRQLQKLQRELQKATSPAQRRKLAEKIEPITRNLERLQAPRAAEETRRASESLRKEQGEGREKEATKQHLAEAQKRIEEARQQRKVALARLQMARLDALMRSLVGRQEALLEEIVRLEASRTPAGELSPARQRSVLRLAENQSMLSMEVVEQAGAITSLPVFAHLLERAHRAMDSAADRLRQQQTDQPTQKLASSALQQLQRISEAVSGQRELLDDQAGQGGGGGDGKKPPEGGAEAQGLQLAIGQIKLLRTLQTELLERTRQMEAKTLPHEPAEQLARQQQELVELAGRLVPEAPLAPLDNLLPNFEKELEQSLQDDWQPTEILPGKNELRSLTP